jgi:thiol-disulfide isomerase/thioredoxin
MVNMSKYQYMTKVFIRIFLLLHTFIGMFFVNYPGSGQGIISFIPLATATELAVSETFSIPLNAESEITVEKFPAQGQIIFIWQPHERGIQDIDRQLASQLAKNNIEVWLVDLLETYFLPNTASNMDRITGDGFNRLIANAVAQKNKVVIGGSGRGAVPVLRGARDWQLQNKNQSEFCGVVLLSPKLFVKTPDPGTAAEFMPIAEASDVAVFILQPDKSPWFWKLNQTINALETNGSDVYLKPLKNLRDRFYFRPDAVEQELAATKTLWQELKLAVNLLSKESVKTRTPAITLAQKEIESTRQERKLQAYKGNPDPPELNLPQLNGQSLELASLKGQVVLVNFWATWCPPCVHEMPSMQRLSEKFHNSAFTILGVNMAENQAEVEKFLQTRVKVDFPIVLDRDGETLKAWSVFAFPTSYVLDKNGNIRYALFGSVEWDNPDITAKIQQLVNE